MESMIAIRSAASCPAPADIRMEAEEITRRVITKGNDPEEIQALIHELTTGKTGCLNRALTVLAGKEDNRPMISLAETEKASVWLLGWRPSKDATDIHDHGESLAGIKVLEGTVEEVVFTPPDWTRFYKMDGGETERMTRLLSAGTLLDVPKPYVHIFDSWKQVDFASSLHVYSPPLAEMRLYREEYREDDATGLRLSNHWKANP